MPGFFRYTPGVAGSVQNRLPIHDTGAFQLPPRTPRGQRQGRGARRCLRRNLRRARLDVHGEPLPGNREAAERHRGARLPRNRAVENLIGHAAAYICTRTSVICGETYDLGNCDFNQLVRIQDLLGS